MTEQILYSPLLQQYSDRYPHGISTRVHGDMRDSRRRSEFADRLGLAGGKLRKPQQIHGVRVIGIFDKSEYQIPHADGLASRQLPIGIITADCAPVLALDPEYGVIGAAHMGWKGTLFGIGTNLVRAMVRLGARPEQIRIVIGPRICVSCYDVPDDRARMFRDRFGAGVEVVQDFNGTPHIDLGRAIVAQMINAGIIQDHIDCMSQCTACNPDRFFSYRKDDNCLYGEIAGMIGVAGS